MFGSALQRTTPGNALEVEVPKSALEGSIRVAVKALLGVPFHSLRIFWDISSTVGVCVRAYARARVRVRALPLAVEVLLGIISFFPVGCWINCIFLCFVERALIEKVSGIIGTGSKHFGQQPNSPSVDVEFVVPIKTNKPRVRLRFWAMDEAVRFCCFCGRTWHGVLKSARDGGS